MLRHLVQIDIHLDVNRERCSRERNRVSSIKLTVHLFKVSSPSTLVTKLFCRQMRLNKLFADRTIINIFIAELS